MRRWALILAAALGLAGCTGDSVQPLPSTTIEPTETPAAWRVPSPRIGDSFEFFNQRKNASIRYSFVGMGEAVDGVGDSHSVAFVSVKNGSHGHPRDSRYAIELGSRVYVRSDWNDSARPEYGGTDYALPSYRSFQRHFIAFLDTPLLFLLVAGRELPRGEWVEVPVFDGNVSFRARDDGIEGETRVVDVKFLQSYSPEMETVREGWLLFDSNVRFPIGSDNLMHHENVRLVALANGSQEITWGSSSQPWRIRAHDAPDIGFGVDPRIEAPLIRFGLEEALRIVRQRAAYQQFMRDHPGAFVSLARFTPNVAVGTEAARTPADRWQVRFLDVDTEETQIRVHPHYDADVFGNHTPAGVVATVTEEGDLWGAGSVYTPARFLGKFGRADLSNVTKRMGERIGGSIGLHYEESSFNGWATPMEAFVSYYSVDRSHPKTYTVAGATGALRWEGRPPPLCFDSCA